MRLTNYITVYERQEERPLSQPNRLWFFLDEKSYFQYLEVNSWNNCWLPRSLQDVPILIYTKHPVHIMIFGVVTDDGDVKPHFTLLFWLTLYTET